MSLYGMELWSAPAVCWPPIRSFRKNLAGANGPKFSSDTPSMHVVSDNASGKKPITCSSRKRMFVKINMDGVPIGPKVDLLTVDMFGELGLVKQAETLFADMKRGEEHCRPDDWSYAAILRMYSISGDVENAMSVQRAALAQIEAFPL